MEQQCSTPVDDVQEIMTLCLIDLTTHASIGPMFTRDAPSTCDVQQPENTEEIGGAGELVAEPIMA